jgi:predicted ATPase/DNA-binding SARP family transcriptional activator
LSTHLNIKLLGPAAITLDNTAVPTIKTTKALALLAYLTFEADRPHRREALAGLLWPEFSENAARSSLRQAVANLRSALEGPEGSGPPLFIASRESLQVNPDARFNLDVVDFEAHIASTQKHQHRRLDTCAVCVSHFSQAAALYRGDLLRGISLTGAPEFENWLSMRREALHRQALQALAVLADAALRTAGFEEALQFAKRQLELEPWRESAHRQAMRAYAYSGQRTAALAQFELARKTLAGELGIEPEDKTVELYYRIRNNSLDPGPADRRIRGTISRPITSLFGREKELAEIERLITNPQCRLLILSGPGGVGKTRLARELVISLEASFPHGAAFISLAAANNNADAVAAISDTVGLRLQSDKSEEEQLLTFLEGKELLLVLDNYEQILPETNFIECLLERAPGVVPLVTSRHRLGLSAEWVYEPEGLFVPPTLNPTDQQNYSSIQLFVDRARRVDHQFQLLAENKQAVAFICRLTGGLPLAIELASALVRYETPAQIASRLQEGLNSLSATHSDLDPRHRSITAAFEQSWRLLSETERQIFSRLSVFQGGFTLERAAEVTGGSHEDFYALIDKSLIMRKIDGRLQLHELLRQYAAAKLAASGQEYETHHKHLYVYLDLAQKGQQELYGSPNQLARQQELEREHANMRAAINWGLANDIEAAAEMAGANWLFYFMYGHFEEARRLFDTLLDHEDEISPETYAWLLNGRCSVALAMDDFPLLELLARRALHLFQTQDNQLGIALSYHHLTSPTIKDGDFDTAQQLTALGLKAARGQPWAEEIVLQHQSVIFEKLGDLEHALETNQHRLFLSNQINDAWGSLYAEMSIAKVKIKSSRLEDVKNHLLNIQVRADQFREPQIGAWIQDLLGRIALATGNPEQAVAHFQRGQEILQQKMSNFDFFADHLLIGIAQTEARRYIRAREAFDQAHKLLISDQRLTNLILLLEHSARLEWLQNQGPNCVKYFSAAAAKREDLNLAPEFPISLLVEETLDEVRGVVGTNEFEALWEEGRNHNPAEFLQLLFEIKNRA